MSTYRVEQEFQNLAIGESGRQQPVPQTATGSRNVYVSPSHTGRTGTGMSYQTTISYNTPEKRREEAPKPKTTFIRIDAASNPSTSVTYNLSPDSPQSRQTPQPAVYPPNPSKPAPPPYSFTVTASPQSPKSPVYNISPNYPGQPTVSMQQRPPSPLMQERRDYETPLPQYTYRTAQQQQQQQQLPPPPSSPGGATAAGKYPQGAPSRLLYTAPASATGYAESRVMGTAPPPQRPASYGAAAPPGGRPYLPESPTHRTVPVGYPQQYAPDMSSRHPEPRPYQLKPTLNCPAPGTGRESYTGSPDTQSPTSPLEKEAEVNALTNLLMQNMEAAADPDFFGFCVSCGHAVIGARTGCAALKKIYHVKCFHCTRCRMCAKCGQPIKGETTGCTALDQLFHIECFTCITCGSGLKGRPFFAMEGKPYCESCYMETLEKCSVCSKSITDRVLRATGKPYHPNCFVCVVCGRSLDSVPFTVDATNQIHCIEDFHKKFAPRCCVCNRPIMPEDGQEEAVRIVAMDKSFHVHCYKCEDCGLVLSSESEGRGCYPLDDHILCKSCNARRIQALTTKMTTEL